MAGSAAAAVEEPEGEWGPGGRRRALPRWADPAGRATLAVHLVVPGDRLDLLSHRYTGDALGFWRVCDANDALDPDALVDAEAVGTEVVVPLPGATT